MKIKQTILIFTLFIGIGGVLVSQPVMAADCGGVEMTVGQSCCGGVITSIISCGETGNPVVPGKTALSCKAGENPYEGVAPGNNTDEPLIYLAKYHHVYGKCANGTNPIMAMVVVDGATCPSGEDPYAEGVDPVLSGQDAVDSYYSKYKHNYGECIGGAFPVLGIQSDSGIWGILKMVINIMTAGIGITAVGGLLFGGILYASSGGSPDNVKKAKTIITDIVIGLVAYALMFAFLNFIIPGGMFA